MARSACDCINVSDFRNIVEIHNENRVRNTGGGFTRGFALVATTRAGLKDASSREARQSDQPKQQTSVVFTMRYRTDFDHTSVFVVGGLTYKIDSIVDVERRKRFLKIKASTGLNSGKSN